MRRIRHVFPLVLAAFLFATGVSGIIAATYDMSQLLMMIPSHKTTIEKGPRQKSIEKKLLACVGENKTQEILTEKINNDDSCKYIYEFYADYPSVMLAYSPKVGRMKKEDAPKGEYVGYYLRYISEKSGKARYQELNAKINEILEKTNKESTEEDKLLCVMKWFEENCDYTETPNNMWDASLYGCMVDGKANCVGFAESFYLIMNRIGIPCEIVIDTEEKMHAWNRVEINGKVKEIDLTAVCNSF